MAADCRDYPNIQAGVEYSAYIHLSGRQKTCLQLGRSLHRSLKVQGEIKVRIHGKGWYSVKFSGQRDYDHAFHDYYVDQVNWKKRWRISGCYSIYVCRWEPNFQFKKVEPPRAGDIVEGRVLWLPLEHFSNDVVNGIANDVCEPLDCPVLTVDVSSEGKFPRFLFRYNGAQLPWQIPIYDGAVVVELSYSRAQKCSHCREYGHINWTCPNRNNPVGPIADPPLPLLPDDIGAGFRAGSRQGTPPEVHEETNPVGAIADPPLPLLPDDIGAGFRAGSSQGTPPPEVHEEINPVGPIPVLNGIRRSSAITSLPRALVEKNMPAKGAMIVEKGEERMPTLYTLAEEVSAISVAVKVTNLDDQSGNLRHLTIDPHIGGNAPYCTKKVLCTSIDGADASRTLLDMCRNKGVSLVVVLDKSFVLEDVDHILTTLGLTAFHRVQMTFRRLGANGSTLVDVKGNCLLMWRSEEVSIHVFPVVTELSSQHLNFNASWVIGESNEEEGPSDTSDWTLFDSSRASSSCSTSVVEGSSNYFASTTTSVCSDGSDSEESSSYPTAPEEVSSDTSTSYNSGSECSDDSLEALHGSPPRSDYGDTDAEGSSDDESFYGSPPRSDYGDTDAEGSSGDEWESEGEEVFNDAEEISFGSSPPSPSSEENDSPRSTRYGSIDESDWEGYSSHSAESTTSGSADTFSPPYGDDTDSEGGTPYHSAAEELSDESSDNSSVGEELSDDSSDNASVAEELSDESSDNARVAEERSDESSENASVAEDLSNESSDNSSVAEELPNECPNGSSSEEGVDYSSPDGDTLSAHGNTNLEGEYEFSASSSSSSDSSNFLTRWRQQRFRGTPFSPYFWRRKFS